MSVIVPPCQEPCCRVKRGETPYPETPEEAGRRIADKALGVFRESLVPVTRSTKFSPATYDNGDDLSVVVS